MKNNDIIFPRELLNKISFSVSEPKARSILVHFSRKAIKDPEVVPKITFLEIRSHVPGISREKEALVILEKLKRTGLVEEKGGEIYLGSPLMSLINAKASNEKSLILPGL